MAGQHIFGYQSKKWRWGLSWQTLIAELPRQECIIKLTCLYQRHLVVSVFLLRIWVSMEDVRHKDSQRHKGIQLSHEPQGSS